MVHRRLGLLSIIIVLCACASTSSSQRATAWPDATCTAVPGGKFQSPVTAPPVAVQPAPTVAVPPTVTTLLHPHVTEPATGAVRISLTQADEAAIGVAYEKFTGLAETFGSQPYDVSPVPVEPVPGKLHAAVITASGARWAFGPVRPVPGCAMVNDGKLINPLIAYPFAGGVTSTGIFEQQLGQPWTMNYFESDPFPCPDDPGLPNGEGAPGYDTPFVPLAVLNAVDVHYAPSGCNNAYVPAAPRG